MSKTEFKIDRLEIRLKGIASDAARASVDGIGQDLLSELAGQQQPPQPLRARGRTSSISRLDSGVVLPDGEHPPAELRQFIARSIAAAIEGKLKR
jgi:hypothetical protein